MLKATRRTFKTCGDLKFWNGRVRASDYFDFIDAQAMVMETSDKCRLFCRTGTEIAWVQSEARLDVVQMFRQKSAQAPKDLRAHAFSVRSD
jgi:hypothetical protein